MPSGNNINANMHELNTVESLCNYYSAYGDELIVGDFNSSCISRNNTNALKAQALTAFVRRYLYTYSICILLSQNAQCFIIFCLAQLL